MTPRTLILAAGAAVLAATPVLAAPKGEPVTITLTNVRADAGPIYVGLQTEAQFMKSDGIAGTVVATPTDGTVTVTLPDVPAGHYALGVWQDTDGDHRFSTASDGMPTDGWSGIGAEGWTAKPTFNQASMTVGATPAAVTVTMIYPK